MYSWEHGHQLAGMYAEDGSEEWVFTYDSSGMRTQRIYYDWVNNTEITYRYIYTGGQLSQMKVYNGESLQTTLHFTYDADGTPLSVDYYGSTYYYETNLQGDVVAILNGSGTKIVTYSYRGTKEPAETHY